MPNHNSLSFTKNGSVFIANDSNGAVANLVPGALLAHYCALFIINDVAITYSVVSSGNGDRLDCANVIDDLITSFRDLKVEFTLLARGIVKSVVNGAMVMLYVGPTPISMLHLHKVDGQEVYAPAAPDISYWVSFCHSKLQDNVKLQILLNDAIALRHAFSHLVKTEKFS